MACQEGQTIIARKETSLSLVELIGPPPKKMPPGSIAKFIRSKSYVYIVVEFNNTLFYALKNNFQLYEK